MKHALGGDITSVLHPEPSKQTATKGAGGSVAARIVRPTGRGTLCFAALCRKIGRAQPTQDLQCRRETRRTCTASYYCIGCPDSAFTAPIFSAVESLSW